MEEGSVLQTVFFVSRLLRNAFAVAAVLLLVCQHRLQEGSRDKYISSCLFSVARRGKRQETTTVLYPSYPPPYFLMLLESVQSSVFPSCHPQFGRVTTPIHLSLHIQRTS